MEEPECQKKHLKGGGRQGNGNYKGHKSRLRCVSK